MTERQISDLLFDLNFTEEESDAFMDMIAYAKDCQSTNEKGNLKTYISEKIDKVVKDED